MLTVIALQWTMLIGRSECASRSTGSGPELSRGDARLESRGIPACHAIARRATAEGVYGTYAEDFHIRTYMDRSYRPFRVCQIRGSIDEATAAYTASYVRIAEDRVRRRWRALDGRNLPPPFISGDYAEPQECSNQRRPPITQERQRQPHHR